MKTFDRSAYMMGNKRGVGKKLTEAGLAKMKDRWGEKNPNWSGDEAKPYSGHARAQRRFTISDKCNRCEKNAQIRHHIDENPLNNVESNIEFLCRSCHLKHHRSAMSKKN
jgi:hypothetical protein